jgi:hypothetical protein
MFPQEPARVLPSRPTGPVTTGYTSGDPNDHDTFSGNP